MALAVRRHPLAALSVEVTAEPDGTIAVRDSKLGEESPVLRFTPEEWERHLDAAKRTGLRAWRLRLASARDWCAAAAAWQIRKNRSCR